jgi:hypothetical protein
MDEVHCGLASVFTARGLSCGRKIPSVPEQFGVTFSATLDVIQSFSSPKEEMGTPMAITFK